MNELGTWKTELTIFLDTEILFNAGGLNGEVNKELFNEFWELVKEANAAQRNKQGKAAINLRYFTETEEECVRYFSAAENIFNDPYNNTFTKQAMRTILNGCHKTSDIVKKKVQFFESLKAKGILAEDIRIPPDDFKYNLANQEIVNRIQRELDEFDSQQDIDFALNLFSKVNFLRQGRNNDGFEKARFFFTTGKHSLRTLAWSQILRENDHSIPFTTGLSYLTDRLWFQLKKGLSTNGTFPKSFDMSTKAQIILANHLSGEVSKKYHTIKAEHESGQSNREELVGRLSELRKISFAPEDQSMDQYEHSLRLLTSLDMENYSQEKRRSERRIMEGEIAKAHMEKMLVTVQPPVQTKSGSGFPCS